VKEKIMNIETVEAVYENGVFRLVAPVDFKLAEGRAVRLVVEPIPSSDEILTLACDVYQGLIADEIDAIEKLTGRRDDFFGERSLHSKTGAGSRDQESASVQAYL
jgi:predicted DNA-binding antitoxin AbrB/MazE fold protein